jgi:hypothetical protein
VSLAEALGSDEEGERLLAASSISLGQLEAVLDPGSYLGSAGAFVAAALSANASAGDLQR